jgi:coenzyme F420-0:L-glutamate ligase/coenzyme F420-1:gamma-L-glutamate ligase
MNCVDACALLRRRRSVRKFQDRAVAKEILEKLIELACTAPSASNRQDWFFTIVTSESLKHAMADSVRRHWKEILNGNRHLPMMDEIEKYCSGFTDFASAPAVVAVSAARANAVQSQLLGDNAPAVAGSITSAAMAAQNLMLASTAYGLAGCCMTGALAAGKELEEILEIGGKRTLVCLVTVGYAAEMPSAPRRKPVSAVSRFLV